MGTKKGIIWAQWMGWNSTSSTKTRKIIFAKPRNIAAYTGLSDYFFWRPHHIHEGGGAEPPWFAGCDALIQSYVLNHTVPLEPPVPYVQVDGATEITFRLSTGTAPDGGAVVKVFQVINYFPPADPG